MVPDPVDRRLRVALAASSAEQRQTLRGYAEANGLEVVEIPDSAVIDAIGLAVADVLLVNLEEGDGGLDLEAMLDCAEIPVLFNDADAMLRHVPTSIAGRAWGRRLAEKIQCLAGGTTLEALPPGAGGGLGVPSIDPGLAVAQPGDAAACVDAGARRPAEIGTLEAAPGAAAAVWVLAASIGGPQAVAQFLQHLPAGLPVAFVVAQHIGLGFVDLLASQLARATSLKVRCGEQDMVLGAGEVAVAPVEQRFGFSQPGRIDLAPDLRNSVYSPCIDDVMFAVAAAYGASSGAFIFSGMGSDGVAGGHAIVEAGGTVFAQEPNGCVVSSMADGARDAGIVSFSGTPAEMARRFLERFGGCGDESVGS